MAEADGVPCWDRGLPWPQRWRLLTDWIRAHRNVFDEATGEASAERQQRRLRARGRTADRPAPHEPSDNQTFKQAGIQAIRQADNQATD